MPSDKYRLPEVDSLKDIGFQFEYSKRDDAALYIQNFIQEHFKILLTVYFFRRATYDEFGNIIEPVKSENQDDSTNVLSWEPEEALVEKIERIKGGTIYPRDYLFYVHPVHANNPEVLIKVFTKKLRALYGAKGNLIYRGSRWGINLTESVSECFHHKILDDLIRKIRAEGIIKPLGISENYMKIKELLQEDSTKTDAKEGILPRLMADHKNKKELAYYQGLLFSEKLTLEKSAKLTIWRSQLPGPIESTILEKERTIKYYLNLQTSSVRKAKDKIRRNRGIQKGKRDEVIKIFKANRRVSHVKIAEMTGVTRKTVAKYINEYISG